MQSADSFSGGCAFSGNGGKERRGGALEAEEEDNGLVDSIKDIQGVVDTEDMTMSSRRES